LAGIFPAVTILISTAFTLGAGLGVWLYRSRNKD
jgi:hypothetical protein